MRSLASPMIIAPDADRSMRAWNSGPVAFSRRIQPSATRAERNAAHDTSTATRELKPSSTTAESIETWAPWLATSNHCTSDKRQGGQRRHDGHGRGHGGRHAPALQRRHRQGGHGPAQHDEHGQDRQVVDLGCGAGRAAPRARSSAPPRRSRRRPTPARTGTLRRSPRPAGGCRCSCRRAGRGASPTGVMRSSTGLG